MVVSKQHTLPSPSPSLIQTLGWYEHGFNVGTFWLIRDGSLLPVQCFFTWKVHPCLSHSVRFLQILHSPILLHIIPYVYSAHILLSELPRLRFTRFSLVFWFIKIILLLNVSS